MFMRKDYLGYNGCIYKRVGVTLYRRLELYLPADTGTYNEPLEDTFHRYVERMDAGTLTPSYADGLHYQLLPQSDRLTPCKKEKV
jgi:hypothetical protein